MSTALAVTEAELLEAIREAAELGRWLLYHTHDSRRSEAGFPDLVLVDAAERDRGVMFVELKTEKGKVTDAQFEWLWALTDAGVYARVIRPSDLTAFVEELTRRT